MIDSQSISYYIPTLKGNIKNITTLKRCSDSLVSKNNAKYSQTKQKMIQYFTDAVRKRINSLPSFILVNVETNWLAKKLLLHAVM